MSDEVTFTVANGYISLPVDVDADTLMANALDAIATALPGWTPNEGNLEVLLLEQFAQMAEEAAQVAAQMPIAAVVYLGTLIGVLPKSGVSATMASTWTMIDNLGYTIPEGTVVGYQATGSDLILFETVADVVVPPGSTTATGVTLLAVVPGTAANGLTTATLAAVDALSFVQSVASTSTSSGGVDAEAQTDYLNRFSAELQLLTPRPILPADYALLAQQTPGVARAVAINLLAPGRTFTDGVTNSTTTLGSPGQAHFTPDDTGRTATGSGIPLGATVTYVNPTTLTLSAAATATATGVHVTLGDLTNAERAVAVAGVDSAGSALSPTVKTALAADLAAKREVNFLVSVIDPTTTTVNVTTTVAVATGADPNAVRAAVRAALQSFLSPAVWGGGGLNPPQWNLVTTVRYLDIATVIHNVAGVDHIVTLAIDSGGTPGAADLTLSGYAPLPAAGTFTVTTT